MHYIYEVVVYFALENLKPVIHPCFGLHNRAVGKYVVYMYVVKHAEQNKTYLRKGCVGSVGQNLHLDVFGDSHKLTQKKVILAEDVHSCVA